MGKYNGDWPCDMAAPTAAGSWLCWSSDCSSRQVTFVLVDAIAANIIEACTLLMSRLSVYMGPAVKVWNAAVQKRVSVTASILSSMKEVKMLGMVRSWTKAIDALRIQEMAYSAKYRTFITYMNLLG